MDGGILHVAPVKLILESDIQPNDARSIDGVDGVSTNLGMMRLHPESDLQRLFRSNSAAFETYKRLDGLAPSRNKGNCSRPTAEKSSVRPLRKHILISEDRIRRNFSFPSLLDEDIIVSPVRWFEHITNHSILKNDGIENIDNIDSSNSSLSYSNSVCSSSSSTVNSPANPFVIVEGNFESDRGYPEFLCLNPF